MTKQKRGQVITPDFEEASKHQMGVSINGGTPKSSIFMGGPENKATSSWGTPMTSWNPPGVEAFTIQNSGDLFFLAMSWDHVNGSPKNAG